MCSESLPRFSIAQAPLNQRGLPRPEEQESMKNSKLLNATLILSGLVAAGIGGAILFMPAAFHATNGIELGGNTSLLNEVRAPGGALLACGMLIVSGAFVASLTFTSLVVSSLLYLSYGLSRILSMVVDGFPVEGLVQATAFEMVIGMVCFATLVRCKNCESASRQRSRRQVYQPGDRAGGGKELRHRATDTRQATTGCLAVLRVNRIRSHSRRLETEAE